MILKAGERNLNLNLFQQMWLRMATSNQINEQNAAKAWELNVDEEIKTINE